ncbi:MAG: SGNH/GDSL hydrolase family protein [Pirellulales bacterium]|nr:SGNH/GDSL hydrolase family protein [Pirellulales bacterium]
MIGSSGSLVRAAEADPPASSSPATWLDLRDGDRVVFLGNTFLEREGRYGHLEARLTALHPGKKIIFRNLGWSGDTVWCDSRAYFDKPADGYRRTLELLAELKPTVIYLSYGGNEAHAGQAGLVDFEKQCLQLIADLKKQTDRIAILEPLPYHAASGNNPEKYNSALATYTAALRKIAQMEQLTFLAYPSDAARGEASSLTYNGLHLDDAGYVSAAKLLFTPPDGRDAQPSDELRQKIIAKNELFFHRWRPQNQTYLFGFRKHEQGQNAKEIAQFDPLVAKLEEEIWALNR